MYESDSDAQNVQNVVHCLVSLPLLLALKHGPYSRVTTAAAAAASAAMTTTKPVRRPCQR